MSSNQTELRVGDWVRTRIGAEHMHPRERAMRLLEEAVELVQAEGVTLDQAHRQVDHVFGRPHGIPVCEAAGVAICLLAWCNSTGHHFDDIVAEELYRIERQPLDQIRGSLARKADADLVVAIPEKN